MAISATKSKLGHGTETEEKLGPRMQSFENHMNHFRNLLFGLLNLTNQSIYNMLDKEV